VGILAWDVRADVAAIADKLCLFVHVSSMPFIQGVFVLTLRQFPLGIAAMIAVTILTMYGDSIRWMQGFRRTKRSPCNVGFFSEIRLSGQE